MFLGDILLRLYRHFCAIFVYKPRLTASSFFCYGVGCLLGSFPLILTGGRWVENAESSHSEIVFFLKGRGSMNRNLFFGRYNKQISQLINK